MNHPLLLVASLALLVFAGCRSEQPPAAPAPAPATKTPITAATRAVLAAADAKDGAVDKVVHRCAGCALGMDGKADHALQVEDYTMHFCKPACYDAFAGDPAAAIAKVQVK